MYADVGFGRLAVSSILLALTLNACDDDEPTGPQPPSEADLVAAYEASTLRTTQVGVVTDLLAAGALLSITLEADGTTSGRLLVPGGAEDGSDLDESLDGTWTFDESTQEAAFDMPADTFVRDMVFLAEATSGTVELSAERTFGNVTITVVLQQIP